MSTIRYIGVSGKTLSQKSGITTCQHSLPSKGVSQRELCSLCDKCNSVPKVCLISMIRDYTLYQVWCVSVGGQDVSLLGLYPLPGKACLCWGYILYQARCVSVGGCIVYQARGVWMCWGYFIPFTKHGVSQQRLEVLLKQGCISGKGARP